MRRRTTLDVRTCAVVAAVAVVAMCFAAHARGEETAGQPTPPRPRVGVEIDFASRYLWRGVSLSDGPVLQPSAWVGAGDYTLTVWQNIDLGGAERSGLNEVDVTLTRSRDWKGFAVESGLLLYLYPNQADAPTTGELSLKLSRPLGGPFSLFTAHAVDTLRYGGSYWGQVGVAAERELGRGVSAECRAALAWGSCRFHDVYMGVWEPSFDAASLDASLNVKLGRTAYLRPHLTLSYLVDGGLRSRTRQGAVSAAGLAIGAEF